MYFVVLEINNELTGPAWQNFFQPWRLTTFDQPNIFDKLAERWTRTIRNETHANLVFLASTLCRHRYALSRRYLSVVVLPHGSIAFLVWFHKKILRTRRRVVSNARCNARDNCAIARYTAYAAEISRADLPQLSRRATQF